MDYLLDAPLYETVSINNQDFLLTHSGLINFDNKKKLSEYVADDFLWNRPKLSDRYYDDIKTILKLFLDIPLPLCMVKSIAEGF